MDSCSQPWHCWGADENLTAHLRQLADWLKGRYSGNLLHIYWKWPWRVFPLILTWWFFTLMLVYQLPKGVQPRINKLWNYGFLIRGCSPNRHDLTLNRYLRNYPGLTCFVWKPRFSQHRGFHVPQNQSKQSNNIWVVGHFSRDLSWNPLSRLKDFENHHCLLIFVFTHFGLMNMWYAYMNIDDTLQKLT